MGTIEERFWPKVDRSGGEDACWPWLAGLDGDGYGRFSAALAISVPAHRVAWELEHGEPFPDGLVTDHLCRRRDCVNPRHIEAVTQLVNLHRSPLTNAGKVACPEGHAFTDENTYRRAGRRYCRTCRREANREAGRVRRAARAAA